MRKEILKIKKTGFGMYESELHAEGTDEMLSSFRCAISAVYDYFLGIFEENDAKEILNALIESAYDPDNEEKQKKIGELYMKAVLYKRMKEKYMN